MYLLIYHALPTSDSTNIDNPNEVGGAYISCYIQSDSLDEAKQLATDEIESYNWLITELDEVDTLDNNKLTEGHREFYEQALIDNSVFIFHTYPLEDEDDEED